MCFCVMNTNRSFSKFKSLGFYDWTHRWVCLSRTHLSFSGQYGKSAVSRLGFMYGHTNEFELLTIGMGRPLDLNTIKKIKWNLFRRRIIYGITYGSRIEWEMEECLQHSSYAWNEMKVYWFLKVPKQLLTCESLKNTW